MTNLVYRVCALIAMAGTITALLGLVRPWLAPIGIAGIIAGYRIATGVAEHEHQQTKQSRSHSEPVRQRHSNARARRAETNGRLEPSRRS